MAATDVVHPEQFQQQQLFDPKKFKGRYSRSMYNVRDDEGFALQAQQQQAGGT
jgi:hypothetical protein